ncbi:D-alanine--poly(phosphoribitol) ligase subunit 1 [compost metagenome]
MRAGALSLSYAELDSRANRLAHRLIDAGVVADVLVGIAAERSLEMLVGLLAVLKAGGAYVPLDPAYPRERLAYMIEDSGVGLLLTQQALQAQLPVPATVRMLLLAPFFLVGREFLLEQASRRILEQRQVRVHPGLPWHDHRVLRADQGRPPPTTRTWPLT